MHKRFIPLGFALLLAACQTAPVSVGAGSAVPTLPLPAPAAGAAHYAVDAARSDVRFLVYKGGPLAAVVGYDHVIRARNLSGDVYLASDFPASSFSLVLPVKDFSVDAQEDRAVEGPDFAKQPSPEAVAGTVEHMFGPEELDVEHYPEVRIQSVKLAGPDWGPDTTIRVTLHGTARDLTVPIGLAHEGDDLVATGSFQILQSEFGIKPHALLGGGLSVADLVRVRFRIVAHKAP